MVEEKEKMSFGNIISMAICASLAMGILNTLKIRGMFFSGLFVASASILGFSLFRLFSSKFKLSNVLMLLISTLIIVFLLISVKSPNQSILPDYPTPQSSPTQTPVSTDNSLTNMMSKFSEKQEELVKVPEKKSPVKNPYLKEKVVFYSKGISFGETDAKWIFDTGNTDLNKLVAEKPEDVKTSVLKVCEQFRAGTPYFVSDGKNKREITIFYWTCDLTIIDRTIPAVIFQKTFDGKPSNSLVIKDDSTEKYEMPMPDYQIQGFLKSLPVK